MLDDNLSNLLPFVALCFKDLNVIFESYNFQVISIGREKYTVGEALFQPSILGLEAHGIVEQLVRSISTVSSDNHRQLLENTVLCGGTASMTGDFTFIDTGKFKYSRYSVSHYYCYSLLNVSFVFLCYSLVSARALSVVRTMLL